MDAIDQLDSTKILFLANNSSILEYFRITFGKTD